MNSNRLRTLTALIIPMTVIPIVVLGLFVGWAAGTNTVNKVCNDPCEGCLRVGALVEKLGPPEKVYEILTMSQHDGEITHLELLYPAKGIDYTLAGMYSSWEHNTIIARTCYAPTSIEARIAQRDVPPDTGGSFRGSRGYYLDWAEFISK